tara:strand:+ start:886 stop:1335 length:450 start_codon:yes stop_codon:yes gene_type:complete
MTCIQESTPVLKKTLDLNFGMIGEDKVEPMIRKYFNTEVINTKLTKGKFCAYDYECVERKTRYELKSRRVKFDTYPTIIINTSKIAKGSTDGNRLILLFLFTDGLFYTEYDRATFDTYQITLMTIIRNGNKKTEAVYNIPTSDLKQIDI